MTIQEIFHINIFGSNPTLSITIIAGLFGTFVKIRHEEIKIKREHFRENYIAFKNSFEPASSKIRHNKEILNEIILSEYPIHYDAAIKFLPNLKFRPCKRIRFRNKWNEYQKEHQILKNIKNGSTVIILYNDKLSVEENEKISRNKILKIYHDLIHISDKKIWL